MCDGQVNNTSKVATGRDNSNVDIRLFVNNNSNGGGAWQGGDYQDYLLDESCDSSIGAWSENGHRDHIDSKNRVKRKESQKRKRSSAIVHGTLITPKDKDKIDYLSPSMALISSQHRFTPHAYSPGQISEAYTSPFTSPLQKFPSTPARGAAGVLITPTPSPHSPITPRGFVQHSHRQPQHGPLTIRNQCPLMRPLSQDKVDDSPLDTRTVLASGWTVQTDDEEEKQEVDKQLGGSSQVESPSTLIDSLMQGVQQGLIADYLVNSPEELTSASSSQSGWETDDCEMTPRLRPKWEQNSPIMEQTSKRAKRASSVELSGSYCSSLAKTPTPRQLSFIRVPSAIFPHTPAPAKRESLGGKRASVASSISSTSSKSSKRSRANRESFRSSTSSVGRRRRRSAHLVSTPRPKARKSKYYSKPPQPGVMPAIVQQQVKGARGRFWSPMNSVQMPMNEIMSFGAESCMRKSTRYSRRSGQDWIRPRTFEVKDQLRVTIYPPQVDDFHIRACAHTVKTEGTKERDFDKTPTQAQFDKDNQQRPLSRSSKSSHGPAPQPPPTRSLPPVPILSYAPIKKTKSKRRLSRSDATSSCCQSYSCSCSQSLTETGYSNSETFSEEGSESCSCTDSSTCTCTTTRSSQYGTEMESVLTPTSNRYSFKGQHLRSTGNADKLNQVLGLPRSAPLYASPSEMTTSVYDPPRSAPYYSSQHPPVLDPLPRLSPFYIDFDHVFGGKRRSKIVARNSVYTSSTFSYNETSYSECTTCYTKDDCQSCVASEKGAASEGAWYDTITGSASYDSSTKSPSSQGSEGDSYLYEDSEQDSLDMPLTPPRSEYQSSLGYLESPGYRVSCIVSPMPQSAKRLSQMQDLLNLTSPPSQVAYIQETSRRGSLSSQEGSISQMTHTTFMTTSSSQITYSPNGKHRQPRSILKTSKYKEVDGMRGGAGLDRRPTMSMVANTLSNSHSAYSSKSFQATPFLHPPQRATISTSTLTKSDLEGRIQREELRRKRNESRLYALEKLEGKTKKSSLFFSLLSNSTASATTIAGGGGGDFAIKEWEEDDNASPLPQTPLTPSKEHLYNLQVELEKRQRVTQFQNNKAVSFTDVIGFDMGTYPKMSSGGGKKKGKSESGSDGSSEDQDAVLKHQLKKLSTAIEARQRAKDKCIDK